ncbi:gliding motility lipoprotein GldK [Mucilaginibacter myungsuensis]
MPYGMVYIPGGSFLMGETDQDITFGQISQKKQVTLAPFFMDMTEVTNSQYRMFVNWVRDSIAVNWLNDPRYYIKPKGAAGAASGKQFINWDAVNKKYPLWKSSKNAVNPNTAKLQGMFYQNDDRVFDRDEIDVRLLKYTYSDLDLRAAANGRSDKSKKRSDYISRDTVAIYPDTLVWLSDFSYAANEPMVQDYFSHPAYQNYPVVGVTWRQAVAFNKWRSAYNNAYMDKTGRAKYHRAPYNLPTEAEFEYAARGGRLAADFPWGGPYIKNAKGCLMANFKPGRGDYATDGGYYTVNVRSYFPNDYGLYNMAGNVAEWTVSAWDESASSFVHDLSPTFTYKAKATDSEVLKRKVVKGGSWKDIGWFLQNAHKTYEYQDTAKSYIGFRSVTSYQGRDINDKR